MFKRGFTLIELLLSVSILVLVSGIGIPIYQSFQTSSDLEVAQGVTVSSLRRAQTQALASASDSAWGIYVGASGVTVFQGSSFATRDVSHDEFFGFSSTVIPSGLAEVVFSKFQGISATTGTIILTSSAGEVKNININAQGTIEY